MKGHRLLGKEFFFAVLATVFTVSVTFAASPENTPADRYRAVVKISKTGTVSVSKNKPVTENANKTGNVTAADEGDSTDSEGRVPVSATDRTEKIGVNLASRILTFYQGSDKVAMYPVGVGSIYTPTPIGYYTVESGFQETTVFTVLIGPRQSAAMFLTDVSACVKPMWKISTNAFTSARPWKCTMIASLLMLRRITEYPIIFILTGMIASLCP